MIIVIGAGAGGLTAAATLARAGHPVTVLEARSGPGGLASGIDLDGARHDGGPYILLDRPGLTWAFNALGARLEDHVDLIHLDHEVYRVTFPDGDHVSVYGDLDRTADAFDARQRGSGRDYRRWVARMRRIYANLTDLQRTPRPKPWHLLRRGLIREGAFLLQGLEAHLKRSNLPPRVRDALGIWTHIAGQPLAKAPAPLAFVPAIIHTHGAYIVRGGMHHVTDALAKIAADAGATLRFGQRVTRILRSGDRVTGVEVDGERVPASHVVSNAPGIATYANLLDPPDPALSHTLQKLPLQSPGVAAYLHVTASADAPLLRFCIPPPGPNAWVRAAVAFGAYDPTRAHHARLVSPTPWDWAERTPRDAQHAFIDRLLDEPWWREHITDWRELERRIPADWGRRYFLYRDSMNPVMTAAFMRRGRIPHQSPVASNLFLAGSATHPGQWVSFCAISGVLAAQTLTRGASKH